jgi:hypothetical protein
MPRPPALLTATALLAASLAAACAVPGEAPAAAPADPRGGGAVPLAGPGGAALVVPVHVNGQGPFD